MLFARALQGGRSRGRAEEPGPLANVRVSAQGRLACGTARAHVPAGQFGDRFLCEGPTCPAQMWADIQHSLKFNTP